METRSKKQSNGPIAVYNSSAGDSTVRCPQPNYDSRAVQEALEHLATIDLVELCNEAKVERCRTTRDLRSCGRYVQYVLNSCGHASLCQECSQRVELCPICKVPIPKTGTRFRPRLYYECIEAGLISKRHDERFQEIGDDEQLTADIERLYSLFDVAMENNLVCLICHYVTDICMDETAVSSDPIISFLLDEVVVKDWCKRTFKFIITVLQGIYKLDVEEMKSRLGLLLKLSTKLAGISNVLEILDSSFKGTLSAQLHDLHHLQESVLRTKQHMEVMIWCIRHTFLENVKSRYTNFKSWQLSLRERKSDAIKRSWPDLANQTSKSSIQDGSLFIEDALENIEADEDCTQEMQEIFEVVSLQKEGNSSFIRSKIEGVAGSYPFENLRSAVDILFLHGSSDLVLAKQGIFLYYLFDRHYTSPDENWRPIIDDFAATFSITRHSLLESFTFYLLDDHTDEALQEACHLLPEIAAPTTHPKIAQVLLERKNPGAALMVLRWSGRDGGSQLVSLSEAVTAVRMRMQCGLITEAFTYQRMICSRFQEKKLKCGPSGDVSDDLSGEGRTFKEWVEALVTEICLLCILGNLVDRMIELPWNSDEEKYLSKCLLDYTIDDPSTAVGSLLVVFYLQRYRYAEAYHVNLKLQTAEEDFISNNSPSEEILSKMRSASHWRAGLVEKSIDLLPEVQRQDIKSGKLLKDAVLSDEGETPPISDIPELLQAKNSTSLLIPSLTASLVTEVDHSSSSRQVSLETPRVPFFHETLIPTPEIGLIPEVGITKSFTFDDISTPGIRLKSHLNDTPFKKNYSSSRMLPHGHIQDNRSDELMSAAKESEYTSQLQNHSGQYSRRVAANPTSTPSNSHSIFNDHAKELSPNSYRRHPSSRTYRARDVLGSEDPMEISWNSGGKDFATANMNGIPRWRSDETSDEEDGQNQLRGTGEPQLTPTRGMRRSSRISRG